MAHGVLLPVNIGISGKFVRDQVWQHNVSVLVVIRFPKKKSSFFPCRVLGHSDQF